MKHLMIGLLSLCAVCVTFGSCGKDDPQKNPVEEPDPQPVASYFISFKYNGTAYEMRSDTRCFFTKHADEYYVMEGSDAEKKLAMSISIAEKIAKNGSYDIHATVFYESSSISILFSSGDEIAESNFAAENIAEAGKIGTLTVTELTDGKLSGTFSCRMKNGEITGGKFTVKAKEY